MAAGILKIFVFWIITNIILIFLPIISIPMLLLRCAVFLIAAIFRRDLRSMVEPGSAYFAHELFYHGDSPGATLLSISEIENEYTVDLIERQFNKNIFTSSLKPHQRYDKLRYRIVQFLGYSFWQTDNQFNLRRHVIDYNDLQRESVGIDWELPLKSHYTESDIKRISGQLMSKPFKMDRSPWEFILLPQPGSNITFQFFRAHHSLCDGYSLLHMANRLFDLDRDNASVLPRFLKPRPWYVEALLRIALPFKMYIDLVDYLANPPSDSHGWMNKRLNADPDYGKYFTTYSDSIPVARIKAIKNKFDVNFNAVVISVSAGALAKMMVEVRTPVPQEVQTYVPFPMPGHRGGLRNHFSGALVTWYPGEPEAEKRLRLSDASLAKTKASTMPIVAQKFYYYYGFFPTYFISPLTSKNQRLTAIMSVFGGLGTGKLNEINTCLRTRYMLTPFCESGAPCCFTSQTADGAVEFGFTLRRSVLGSSSQGIMDRFTGFINEELALLETK